MQVLQILSQLELTGAEAHTLTLSQFLLEKGHSVTVVSNRLHLPTKSNFVAMDIHTDSSVTRWKNIFKLRRLIKERNIQIVHCHSRAAVRVGYWATLFLPVALVSTVHGRQHPSLSKKLWDQYGDRVIGVCDNILEQLRTDFKMNPRKMISLGNPVQVPAEITDLTPKGRIAIIGRTSGPKGLRSFDLLKELAQVLQDHPGFSIDIIGGSEKDLKPEFVSILKDLQRRFSNRVNFLGHVNDLHQRYQNYDLIIGSGRIAIEAMMNQRPCLALGEYSCEGILKTPSYESAKRSNFGDMGAKDLETSFDYKEISEEVSRFLAQLNNSQTTSDLKEELQLLRAKVIHDFSTEQVCSKILEVYQSTYFQKLHPAHIPVLMYHKVPEVETPSKHRIFVTKSQFEKHLQFFKNNGFQTLSFTELDQYRRLEKPAREFPKKPLILTFDDGYVDNLTNAGPLLKKYDMKATIFLLADTNVRTNSWDADTGEPPSELMSLEQKQELKNFNFEIGSHGFRHQKITQMNAAEAKYELEASKRELEKQFGIQIPVYAFTYGITSPRDARLAQEAGYRFAVNTDTGGLHLEENPYAIFRTPIFPEDGPTQLRKKTAKWYRRYFFMKRGK